MVKTLFDKLNESATGCYRKKGTQDEIVQASGFTRNWRTGDPVVSVWYPLENRKGTISLETSEQYEECSAVEIEKIRREREVQASQEARKRCDDSVSQTTPYRADSNCGGP